MRCACCKLFRNDRGPSRKHPSHNVSRRYIRIYLATSHIHLVNTYQQSNMARTKSTARKSTAKGPENGDRKLVSSATRESEMSTTKRHIPIFHFTASFLDKSKLKRAVNDYKYISPTKTKFEKLFLNDFWAWMSATWYPNWLAPNVITLTGFIAFLGPIATAQYSGNLIAQGTTPNWWLLCACVFHFVYQTADGSDGPQARRLKCGSALGELVDHGADAIVASLFSLSMAEVCGIGMDSIWFLLLILGAQMAFVCSNMTLLHKSSQEFSEWDAQEAQVVGQCLLLGLYVWNTIHGVEGRGFMERRIPLPGSIAEYGSSVLNHMRLNQCGVNDGECITSDGISIRAAWEIGAVYSLWSNAVADCIRCRRYYFTKENKEKTTFGVGKGLEALTHQWLSFFVWCSLSVFTWSKLVAQSKHPGYYSFFLPWFITWAVSYGDFANHFLVIRVTRVPFPSPFRHRSMLWMVACAACLHFAESGSAHGWDMTLLMRLVAGASILSHVTYCSSMGGAIGEALGVPFFAVKSRA
jgi:phosphatidylglycerophosphate synthase